MKRKKVMLLGGNYYQMTATKAAKRLGYYVISVDYLPDNPAHKYADEYYNVSTIDKEAVLELAKKLSIDGIISYASDVSAPTAAFVAENMGLPTNPYDSVLKLTRKDLIRPFMKENGFRVPESKVVNDINEALEYIQTIELPVMIKPVDSSGSKGITKLQDIDDIPNAYNKAKGCSVSKRVIIEKYIKREGFQISGDALLLNGKLSFCGLMDNHFDEECNGFVPIGSSFPSTLPLTYQKIFLDEVQRLMSLLNMKFGALNLEGFVDDNGNVYVLEVGPRNGGSLIPDALKLATGVDLAEYTIKTAVGENCRMPHASIHRCVSSYNLHVKKNGVFSEVKINPQIQNDILRFDLFVHSGELVYKFENSSMSIGSLLIQHTSIEEMTYRMEHMDEFIHVVLE